MTGCDLVNKTVGGTSNGGTDTQPRIILMAGQSNMAGWNFPKGIPSATSSLVYWNDPGTGPIISFANSIHIPQKVIIVNCAKSGTYIEEWLPGMTSSWGIKLYDTCIDMANQAIKQSGGRVDGFVFLQGEADCGIRGPVTYNWAQSFTSIVMSLRFKYSNVSVVMGQIGATTANASTVPFYQHIKNEQSSVSLSNYVMVKTDDLELADSVHHTDAAYTILGQRFAQAWYGLTHE